MSILTCNPVTLGYDGIPILRDINFAVGEDSYLCIIGENGAGKSTLIKGILGLVRPMSGRIETGDGLRSCEIGYLPQQTMIQKDFPASVSEVVLSGRINSMRMRPFYSRSDRLEACRNMELLDILDLKDSCYQELSGGQQQRVLLARALSATHKLLLLDEPVSGLDPTSARSMYELIARINREQGIAVIMVSHDLSAAMKYSNHILHLSHRQLYFGKTSEYVTGEDGAVLNPIELYMRRTTAGSRSSNNSSRSDTGSCAAADVRSDTGSYTAVDPRSSTVEGGRR